MLVNLNLLEASNIKFGKEDANGVPQIRCSEADLKEVAKLDDIGNQTVVVSIVDIGLWAERLRNLLVRSLQDLDPDEKRMIKFQFNNNVIKILRSEEHFHKGYEVLFDKFVFD